MYIPKQTLINNNSEIHEFIDSHRFAVLVSTIEGRLNAAHLPVLLNRYLSKSGTFYCPISKENDQLKNIE